MIHWNQRISITYAHGMHVSRQGETTTTRKVSIVQTQHRVGQQFGNYRLTKLIGHGGYAEVYLATHIHLDNRQHAIKILTGTNLKDEQRASFLAEARTVANLQHLSPHIVQIQDFGIQTSGNAAEDGIPYLVMEYAAAGTMRTLYPQDTQVPLERVVFYINQVAQALQCAHDQKPPIIHRDIKPENMLLRTHDHLLLSDFGIAITGQTSSNVLSVKETEIVGTVTYMAPERLSKHTRRASDQYSLGIVVYEWLSGSPPFDGTEKEIIYKQLVAPPPPLSSEYPHITKEIEDIVLRALEKAPEDRYPNVQEFASALEQAIEKAPRQKQTTQRGNTQSQHNRGQKSITPVLVPSSSVTVPQSQPPALSATIRISQFQTQPATSPDQQAHPPLLPAPPLPQPSTQTSTTHIMPDRQAQSQSSPASPSEIQPSQPLILPASQGTLSLSPAPQPPLPPVSPTAQVRPQPSVLSRPLHYTDYAESFSQRGRVPAIPSERKRGIREFFDFSSQFFWHPDNAPFINVGIALNVLSAILVGFLLRSYYDLAAALVFSLLMFILCICAVEIIFATFFGVLVALYWLMVGWITGSFLASWLHLNPFLPPLFLSSVLFIASLTMHIRYAAKKYI